MEYVGRREREREVWGLAIGQVCVKEKEREREKEDDDGLNRFAVVADPFLNVAEIVDA